MAEKINLNDLFDFSNLKSLKELEKRLDDVAEALDGILKTGKAVSAGLDASLSKAAKSADQLAEAVKKAGTAKELSKLEKPIDDAAKAYDNLTEKQKQNTAQNKRLEEALKATNKERQNSKKKLTEQEKLQNKLQGVIRGETQEVQRLRVALAEANKESKQAARESLGLVSAYEKESKRLNELRKRYKDLAVQKGIDAEETQKLGKEVAELDQKLKDIDKSAGQFGRVVGQYENALKSAGAETKGFTSNVNKLDSALNIGGNIILILETLKNSFAGTGQGQEDFRIGLAKLAATFGVVASSAANFVKVLIKDLPDALSLTDILTGNVDEAKVSAVFNKAASSFDNLSDRIKVQIEDSTKLEQSIINLERETRTLNEQLAEEAAAYELLTQKADDSTISLEKRLKFSIEAGKQAEKAADIEVKAAEKALEVANERVRIEEDRSNTISSNAAANAAALENAIEQAKAQALPLSVIQKLEEKLNEARKQSTETLQVGAKATKESLDEQSAAIIALTQAENNREIINRQNVQQRRELESDLIEQNLDLLIDAADFEKAVNERRLADERLSLEERAKILKETEKLQKESVEAQVAELQKATEAPLDIQELQKTLTEEGAEAFTEQAKALGLSEVLALRLLEVVKENAVATQDLAEANKDLRDQGFDKDLIEEEIKLQEERLKKIKEIKGDEVELIEEQRDAEEKLLQLQIDALQREIEERKKAGEVVLEEQKELNDLLLQQQEARINKELENEQKAADQRTEIFNSPIAEGLIDGIAARQTKQAEILEKQAELTEDEAEKQELLAKAAKEREKAELRILFIETLKSGLQAGKSPTEATQEAILVTAGAKIAADVAGFHDGGYTGDGGEWTEAGVVHKGEMVQTKKQVGIYGMKGWSAADFDNAVQSGYFRKFEVSDQLPKGGDVAPAQLIDYSRLAKEVGKEVASSIPQTSYKWIEDGLLRTERKGLSSASYKIKRKSKSL